MKRLLFIIAALFATAQSQTIQTIGAPTTTVVSRGNFRTDSIFYLPKRQKLPTDSGAVRYQISDSSVYYWTGSQWRRLGVHIDTAAMLLPYLRDADTTAMLSPYLKESDTVWLSNRINLKVNIADTSSMLTPYLRGSGNANYLPIFDATRSVINSKVYQSGNHLMFNTTTPSVSAAEYGTMDVNGSENAAYILKVGDAEKSYILSNGTDLTISNNPAGDLIFRNNNATRGRFTSAGQFRVNNLASASTRLVTADTDGNLAGTASITQFIDTTEISTRDWRQKGDDSLGAIIATKGSGTVTSVATGYGLSGGTITTTGTIIVDSAIVASRLRVGKVVDSLALVKQNILTNPVTGTGTTNYVPKFTGTSTIGNSLVYDDGEVKINRTTDAGDYMLQVAGGIHNTTGAIFAATSGNVGIGVTTTPSAKLDVQGNLTSDYVSLVRLRNGDAGTTNAAVAVEYWDRTTNINAATIGQRQNIAGNWAGEMLFRVQQNLGSPQTSTTSLTTMLRLDGGGQRLIFAPNGTESMRLNTGSELLLNTTTDAGDYKLQVNGAILSSGGAVFAGTSGSVGIGTTIPSYKLDVIGDVRSSTRLIANGNLTPASWITNATTVGYSSSGNYGWITAGGASDYVPLSLYGEVLVNTTTDAGDYKLQVSGNAYVTGTTVLAATSGTANIGSNINLETLNVYATSFPYIGLFSSTTGTTSNDGGYVGMNGTNMEVRNKENAALLFYTNNTTQGSFNAGGELLLGVVDQGNYKLQVGGAIYTNNSAVFADGTGGVSIGSTDLNTAVLLQLTSTTKGFLPPRMTTTQRDAISSPPAGLVIYNTTTSKLQVYTTAWTDLH